ncbi:GNAT family N-acetyltransferase [Aquibacillus saliphilus]|uniref:GNAT family N-acetyltransferase n=1 Tax=Aquibacillus saliphilus TaxID=1909422 RepID=UPI001CF028CE|nr:GNAT family protein [Aquibacillus saliphilus]
MLNRPVVIQFETNSLLIRNINLNDKKEIYSIYSDPGVLKFDNSSGFSNIKEAEDFIRQILNPHLDDNSIRWAIINKETGNPIGTCGFRNWDRESRHAEIGGNFMSKYWGKGFATELIPKIVQYGFDHLRLNKIHAYTLRKNKAVLKLLERYQFKREGYLREYQLVNGRFEDVVIYGKLKSDGHL